MTQKKGFLVVFGSVEVEEISDDPEQLPGAGVVAGLFVEPAAEERPGILADLGPFAR